MQYRPLAVVVCLALAIAGSAPAGAAGHGARLTYFGDPRTSIAIGWNSDSAADDTVSYGTAPDALTQSVKGTAIAQPSPLGTAFVAALTWLQPGTTYYYRVAGHPADGEAPFSFTTLPGDPCAPLRFVLIGDNRQDLGDQANPIWGDILEETLAFDPAFYVNTGDMVLDGNTPAQWASFIDISEPGWALVPSILTMGNHDDHQMTGEGALYNQLYELPRNPDGVEDYYAIDIGPIHFVSLNSQYNNPAATDMATMVAWLQADLAATAQPWKIVFFHKAIYSRGNHHTGEENEASLNTQLIPIFDAHHVDLVVNGHSHNYERYAPSRGVDAKFGGAGRMLPAGTGASFEGKMDVPDGATGTTYLVTGGAGALTTELGPFECIDAGCTFCTGINLNCDADVWNKDKEATVTYEGKHNFVVVDVDGDTMRFQARTTVAGNTGGGQVIEEFTITKTSFDLTCGQTGTPDAGPGPGTPDAGGGNGGGPDGGGPGLASDSGGGCGCRAGGDAGARAGGALAALALGAILLARRRRRR
jgi:MYXO-CTERM domain-containing protein